MTVRYLSLEWIDEMQANVAASESMAALSSLHDIGVTQVITDGPEGNIIYHLQVGGGSAVFGAGPAPTEHVRMEQSWETAVAVATDSMPAQEVFLKGLVRITGDAERLVSSAPVFAALDAAFVTVRAHTVYE